jgi:hypothetical protein
MRAGPLGSCKTCSALEVRTSSIWLVSSRVMTSTSVPHSGHQTGVVFPLRTITTLSVSKVILVVFTVCHPELFAAAA